MNAIINRYGIVCLLAAYLLLAIAYSLVVPLAEGPDEIAHFEYMRFIVAHRRLPLTLEERIEAGYKSDLPPFYYLLAAIPSSFVNPEGPPYLKRVENSPRHQLVKSGRAVLNTEDERMWPGQAEYLMWRLGRWLSILFGAGVMLATWFVARQFFPDENGLALGAAAVAGFIPRFTLTGSLLNYETLQALLTTLSLWLLLKLSRSILRKGPKQIVLGLFLGLIMGFALITKYSTVLLPLEAGLVVGLIGWQQRWPRPRWLGQITLILIPAIIIAGCWFGFVLWNFNRITDLGWVTGFLKPLAGTDASDTTTTIVLSWLTAGQPTSANTSPEPLWRWLFFFFHSFWVVDTGGNGLPLPALLVASAIICLAAALGLYYWWQRDPDNRWRLAILLLHAFIFLPLPFFRFLVTRNVADTSQGRHWLFPAVAAIALLLVGGLREITPQKQRRWVGPAILIWLFPWNLFQLWVATWGYEALLPIRTTPEAVTQAQQSISINFGDTLKLVGYNPPVISAGQMLSLDLVWQATDLNPIDYLTEVSLIDKTGVTVAQWLGHPVNGRYPTRAWDRGDVVRDMIQLPLLNLPAGRYKLNLRLLTPQQSSFGPAEGLFLTEVTLKGATAQQTGVSIGQAVSEFIRSSLAWLISPFPHNADPIGAGPLGLSVWQPGRPHPYQDGETITLIAQPQAEHPAPEVWLVDPAGRAWAPERVVDHTYLFIVGPRWSSGPYQLRVKRAEEVEEESIPLVTVFNRWSRQFEAPLITQPLVANFANQINLLGYDLPQRRVKRGEALPLTMYWQAPAIPPQTNFIQFNHLLDSEGVLRGGYDRLPLENYSTLLWASEEVVVDGYVVPVAADASPGQYYLNIGYYFTVGKSIVYLPLVVDGQMSQVNSVTVGPIEVLGP